MTRRAYRIDRETQGAIDFDAALETYLDRGDPEELLQAAALVLGSSIPLDEERAEILAALTGCPYVLADYDGGGPDLCGRRFALMGGLAPGANLPAQSN